MLWRSLGAWLCAAAIGLVLAGPTARAEAPSVRIAVLKFGTVNWLMETIRANGLDRAEGIQLDVVALAGKPATTIAFRSGDADILVTDWVWALRQRSAGQDLRFAPYSTALGALVGRPGQADLCALKGADVGVVGGEFDKSWLVLQAVAQRDCGFDLAAETEALYGAPPLMSRQLTTGTVDAVSTFWPFVARLEAQGMPAVLRIDAALERLGIAPAPALVGFVWDRARSDPDAVAAFLRAARQASEILAEDDAAWTAIRPLMRAKTEAEFLALRDAYRAGITAGWTEADTESARALHALLGTRAGAAFTEKAGPFDAQLFSRD
ncbi:MAG: ABC transporter substrate-binding protein [Pseudomonadota bacterium]